MHKLHIHAHSYLSSVFVRVFLKCVSVCVCMFERVCLGVCKSVSVCDKDGKGECAVNVCVFVGVCVCV